MLERHGHPIRKEAGLSSLPGDQPHPGKPHQDAESRVDPGKDGGLAETTGTHSQEMATAFHPTDIKARNSLAKREGLHFRK